MKEVVAYQDPKGFTSENLIILGQKPLGSELL